MEIFIKIYVKIIFYSVFYFYKKNFNFFCEDFILISFFKTN